MTTNINDLLKEYEQMMAEEGEQEENITVEEKETKPQQQSNPPQQPKQQYQQPLPSQQQQNQPQPIIKENYIKDQPQQQQQQQQSKQQTQPPQSQQHLQEQQSKLPSSNQSQQQVAPKQSIPQPPLTQIESQLTQVKDFKSFSLISNELQSIQSCLKQPIIANNQTNKDFYLRLEKSLSQQLDQLSDFVEQGKLRANIYDKFIVESMKIQKQRYDQAEQIKSGLFMKRIQKRMQILQTEMQVLKSNQTEGFKMIVTKANPKIKLPEQVAPKSKEEIKQQIKQQLKDSHNLSDFKSNLTAEKVISAEIDTKEIPVKFEALLKRYKEYYNLIHFLSQHKKNERQEQLNALFQRMEKGKQLREDFVQGKNPHIGNFLVNELQPLSFDVFHLLSQAEFKEKINQYQKLMWEGENKEKELYKICVHAKRNQNPLQPHQESKKRQEQYKEQLLFLQELRKQQWVLLPEIEEINLSIQVVIENKDMPPNKLRIIFHKLSNCKFEKYFLSFVVDGGKTVLSNKTPVCNESCVFNAQFDLDIPLTSDLATKSVEVRLFEKGFFSNSELGVGKFCLEGLKNNTTVENGLPIKTKKGDIILSYSLFTREPLDKVSILNSKFYNLKKFPLFDPNEGMKEFVERFMEQLPTYEQYRKKKQLQEEQIKREEVAKKQQMELEQQQQQQQQQQEEQILITHLDSDPTYQRIKQFLSTNPTFPQGIDEKDILYPENPAKFPVFNFIQPYSQFLKQKTVELRQEPSYRQWFRFTQQMWEDHVKWVTIIDSKLKQENFEWYFGKIENLLPLENYLLQTYEQLQATQWVKFIKARKAVLEKELEELSQM